MIYSCGAHLGHDALPVDYLGDYVRDVFRLIGFTDFHQVRMTGAMSSARDIKLAEAENLPSPRRVRPRATSQQAKTSYIPIASRS